MITITNTEAGNIKFQELGKIFAEDVGLEMEKNNF
jgi:hypothetical protein